MNDKNIERISEVYKVRVNVEYLRNAVMMNSCPARNIYLQNQLVQEIDYIILLVDSLVKNIYEDCSEESMRQNKEFTIEELSNYSGEKGKPAYVAVNGVVYDVSNEPTWAGGSHFGLIAGKDLTNEYNSCHAMGDVLLKLPKVGILK